MMLKLNRSKQRGISLLEVLLSLSVIAIILVMATRYYRSAQQSQQVSNAVSMISGIVTAETQYKAANNNTFVDLATLVTKGYLPPNFGTDPWGGTLSVTEAGGEYTIASTSTIPPNTCTMLNTTLAQSASSGGCDGGKLSVNYQ